MKQNKPGIRLRWLSVCCYEFDFDGTHIVTDPYITLCSGTDLTWEVIEKCHMVAITHNHWDHIADLPPLVERFDPLILCPEQSMEPLARWLNANPSRIYPMYPDVELDFGTVKVRPLFGRHVNLREPHLEICAALDRNPMNQKVPGMIDVQHIGNLDYRAYLFTRKNGAKVLFWGGNLTPEQFALCRRIKPDVVIIQMSPSPWGMARRADFAAETGAKVVMLQHQGMRPNYHPGAVEQFGEVLHERAPHITYINPVHGEWIEL